MQVGVFKKFSIVVCAVFIFITAGYALYLGSVRTVELNKSFCFLTLESGNVQVSSLEIQRDGGAGFLLQDGNKDRVAFCVYLNVDTAKKVFQKNVKEYPDLSLTTYYCDKIYLKGLQKSMATQLENALNTLYGHICSLNSLILLMDDGLTQESSKRILQEIKGNFEYLEKEYSGKLINLSALYRLERERIEKQTQNIVRTKELRYSLCALTKGYIDLCGEYSL